MLACYCNSRPSILIIVGNFSSITRQKGMGQVRSLCANLLQQVHHLNRITIIIHCSSTATSHCHSFSNLHIHPSFCTHIALHFSIHVLMFGSATFLTLQYWSSQPNKHNQEPHFSGNSGICLLLHHCRLPLPRFGHYSAAALASAHFFPLKTLSSFAWNF